MDNKNWKNIEGYEGKYQINEYGHIMSFKKNENGLLRKWGKNTVGYPQIDLWKDNIQKFYLIHRLVAKYFLNVPEEELLDVNHKDGNKENCHYSNLENISHKENCQHREGLKKEKVEYDFGQLSDNVI